MTTTAVERAGAEVSIGRMGLKGILAIPPSPAGLIIFAHGSGSGRLSPRNNHVAAGLREQRLATLLLDLLTPAEESDRANVFDIPLLASRLRVAVAWARGIAGLESLPIGYFGASTGAGAALLAAASPDTSIGAIVSRGGRVDLAGAAALAQVKAPTLLIVGSLDEPVIELNRLALRHMQCESELAIVPGASHLFEEGTTLDTVIELAAAWFNRYLPEQP
jgi:putative phosphoribosyl transferase